MKVSQKSIDVENTVKECHQIANNYITSWSPINSEWKTVKGAAYLRLSTDEQVIVEKGSLEQQVHMAIQEAESRSKHRCRNYRITKFYIEPGISGTKSNRKEFQALKRSIRNGDFAFVTFKEISRIARDSEIWKEFFKLCHSKKCEIVIRGLPIDPNDPGQILQLDILAVFAEYEAKVTAKRIRDSVFSAMLNSGKFNSTHRILGLSPLVVNGKAKVGYYQANEDELVTVKWIMETFVKYGSHQKVIELCNERGVRNWNGQSFKRHSLINLLTNMRYIGKWKLNENNQLVDADTLPESQQFHEVDLPHGAVIPLQLWHQVQTVLKEVAGNLGKNTRVSRVYPLSGGILQYSDKTSFRGCSGTGKTCKSYYYFNEKNGLRIPCELIEQNVVKMVIEIIKNSPEVQGAIKSAGIGVQDAIQVHKQQISVLQRRLHEVDAQKKIYIKKLDVLIGVNASSDDVQLFRTEFKNLLQTLNSEKRQLEIQIEDLKSQEKELEITSFTWTDIAKQAQPVLDLLREKDPVALKRAYYALFDAIIVNPEDNLGNRKITYVLKNSPLAEDGVRHRLEMVVVR